MEQGARASILLHALNVACTATSPCGQRACAEYLNDLVVRGFAWPMAAVLCLFVVTAPSIIASLARHGVQSAFDARARVAPRDLHHPGLLHPPWPSGIVVYGGGGGGGGGVGHGGRAYPAHPAFLEESRRGVGAAERAMIGGCAPAAQGMQGREGWVDLLEPGSSSNNGPAWAERAIEVGPPGWGQDEQQQQQQGHAGEEERPGGLRMRRNWPRARPWHG